MSNALVRFQQQHWRETAGLTTAAFAAGWIAWGGEVLLSPLSILLPLLWAVCKSRGSALVVALAYYLAATRLIPQSSAVFFSNSNSLMLGIALWFIASLTLACVWAALWTKGGGKAIFLRFLFVEALLILPPIGIIGWANPLMGAAVAFPGMGWAAIALGILAIWSVIWLARTPSNKAIAAFVILAAASGVIQSKYREPPDPNGWIAFTTNAGNFPNSPEKISDRIIYLSEGVRAAASDDFSVVIFPEQILGRWNDNYHPRMLRAEIGNIVKKDKMTVLLGAELPFSDSPKAANGLVVLSEQAPRIITARQAVPVSMWRPWSDEGIVSDWWKTGVHEINGVRIAFSFCFEDFMAWPILTDFLLDNPQAIVSVANGWWVQGSDEQKQQAQHIGAWGKIFGVPVLRSLNAS